MPSGADDANYRERLARIEGNEAIARRYLDEVGPHVDPIFDLPLAHTRSVRIPPGLPGKAKCGERARVEWKPPGGWYQPSIVQRWAVSCQLPIGHHGPHMAGPIPGLLGNTAVWGEEGSTPVRGEELRDAVFEVLLPGGPDPKRDRDPDRPVARVTIEVPIPPARVSERVESLLAKEWPVSTLERGDGWVSARTRWRGWRSFGEIITVTWEQTANGTSVTIHSTSRVTTTTEDHSKNRANVEQLVTLLRAEADTSGPTTG